MHLSNLMRRRVEYTMKPIPRANILRRLDGRTTTFEFGHPISEGNNIVHFLKAYCEAHNMPFVLEKFRLNPLWGRRRLSKVLSRILGPEFHYDIVDFFDWHTCRIQISCRYRDILRCSDTKHFSSCFSMHGCNNHAPVKYLENPGIAIVYSRDKHGQFEGRAFLYLLEDNRVLVGRPYGIFQLGYGALVSKLNQIEPRFVGLAENQDYLNAKLKYPINTYSDIPNEIRVVTWENERYAW